MLDYKPAEDGIMLTSALAQMIVDYNKSVSTPSPTRGFTEDEMRGFTKWLLKMYMPVKGGWRHRGAFNDKFKPVLIESLMNEYIASLPSKISGEDWVKVEDGLPEVKKPVVDYNLHRSDWVLASNGKDIFVDLAAWDGESWFTSGDPHPETRITHWRYLPPAPPKP